MVKAYYEAADRVREATKRNYKPMGAPPHSIRRHRVQHNPKQLKETTSFDYSRAVRKVPIALIYTLPEATKRNYKLPPQPAYYLDYLIEKQLKETTRLNLRNALLRKDMLPPARSN